MVPSNYTDRVLAFGVVIFFHYVCYLCFIVLEAFEYSFQVHICYELRKQFAV